MHDRVLRALILAITPCAKSGLAIGETDIATSRTTYPAREQQSYWLATYMIS